MISYHTILKGNGLYRTSVPRKWKFGSHPKFSLPHQIIWWEVQSITTRDHNDEMIIHILYTVKLIKWMLHAKSLWQMTSWIIHNSIQNGITSLVYSRRLFKPTFFQFLSWYIVFKQRKMHVNILKEINFSLLKFQILIVSSWVCRPQIISWTPKSCCSLY